MRDCAENPNIVRVCMHPNRLDEFLDLGLGLDKCQKSLNDYLDSKRRIFPRYFIYSTSQRNLFYPFAFQILLHFNRGIIIDPGQQRTKLCSRAYGEGEFRNPAF